MMVMEIFVFWDAERMRCKKTVWNEHNFTKGKKEDLRLNKY